MTNYHMSPITRMERCVELIEELKTHPHQAEVMSLAQQQLDDMYQDNTNDLPKRWLMTVRTLDGLTLQQAILANAQRRDEKKEEVRQNNYHDEIGKPSLFYEV